MNTTTPPDWMTPEQAIAYLQLEAEGGDPRERLRNLCRRQFLPCHRRGRLIRFSRQEIDAWLAGKPSAKKSQPSPRLAVG